jgi:TonB family protein
LKINGIRNSRLSKDYLKDCMSQHRLSLFIILFISLSCMTFGAQAAVVERRLRVAVLDFGETETGRRAADRVAGALTPTRDATATNKTSVIDREQARAAARGNGYAGSLNLTLEDARTLGAAIGCDFFITGEAQTVRRSPSDRAAHYEAYAAIFIVSTRTGRLLKWERPSTTAATPQQAESALLVELESRARTLYQAALHEAQEKEAGERAARLAQADAEEVFEDLSGVDAMEQNDLRLPQPYRRLRPPYPETAARYEVEATVDALVDIDREGEVSRVEITRWAGFGLDDAVVATVRQLHFRPAMREGTPQPVRVLLRYNFRRPPKTK